MKNITVTVDDDLYRRARVCAAERGTTVTAFVRGALRTLTEAPTEGELRRSALQDLYAEVDAKRAEADDERGLETGWRQRMYDERFENSVLGRAHAARTR